MLTPGDQLRRIEELTDRIRQPRERRSEGATLIGKVISVIPGGAYSPALWTVRPQDIGGSESEGSTVTYSDAGDTILGLHLTKPTNGQAYLYRLVQGRWVADKSCLPSPPPANCQLRVHGCNGLGLPGAAVEIYSGATLIASGTTDSSGVFAYYLPATGVYRVVVTRARFVTYDANRTLVCTSGGTLIEPEVAAGYHCIACCAIPAPDTLYADFAGIGVATIAWNGTYWVGTLPVSRSGATAYRVEDCIPPNHICEPVATATGSGTVTWDITFVGSNCSVGFFGKTVWVSELLACNPPPGTDPCTRQVWLLDGSSCTGADAGCSCFPSGQGGGGVGSVSSCEPVVITASLAQGGQPPCETPSVTIRETP